MKERHIIRRSLGEGRRGKTDWSQVARLTDKEVLARAERDPDAQPTDAKFWKNAQVVMPERKVSITLRVDPDVLAWFKNQGGHYQTRMNAVLKAYMRSTQE